MFESSYRAAGSKMMKARDLIRASIGSSDRCFERSLGINWHRSVEVDKVNKQIGWKAAKTLNQLCALATTT